MAMAFFISAVLILVTIAWHFWCVRGLYRIMPDSRDKSVFLRSVLALAALFMIHIVEILWFTGGYYAANEHLALGGFSQEFAGTFEDYFYFSTVSYSTLGLSAFNPKGAIKILTGLEALTGFVMLTWSATFFYNLTGKHGKPNS